jgi:hypothetical protein
VSELTVTIAVIGLKYGYHAEFDDDEMDREPDAMN